MLRIDGKNLVT